MGRAHEKVEVHTDKGCVEEGNMWTVLKPPALGGLDSSEGKYSVTPIRKNCGATPLLGSWHPTCETGTLTPDLPDIHHAFIPQESVALVWNVLETTRLDQ